MTPIHFLVPFWGDKYRHYFEDCLWRSLGPQLRPEDKVVVACPDKDARACLHLPLTHILFDPDPSRPVYWNQNEAQKHLLRWAFDRYIYASLQSPDMIVSSGFVAALQRRIDRGEDVVQYTALRQNETTLFAEIGSRRSFAGREVADLNIRHLHHECDPLFEGDPRQPWLPPLRLWRVGGQLVIHSFICVPILMNLAKLHKLNLQCVKHLAFENIFLDKNFLRPGIRWGHVTDSDELGIISLSPDYPSAWHHPRRYPRFWRELGFRMSFYLWPRAGWQAYQQGAVWHPGPATTLVSTSFLCCKRWDPLSWALGWLARWYLLYFRPWCARSAVITYIYRRLFK